VRKHGKIDENQPAIVKALRQVGASVVSLSNIGDGCPDLLVGFRKRNYLMEVKDSSRKPSERRLTYDESQFHGRWVGQICVVETVEEALSWLEHGVALEPK
jgi:hypothetical protein